MWRSLFEVVSERDLPPPLPCLDCEPPLYGAFFNWQVSILQRGDESRENGKMTHRETNKLSVLRIRVSRVEWQPGPVRLPELRLFSVRLCPADRRYQFLHPASWSATRQQERRGLCWTQTALAASPAQDPRPDLGFLPITCGRAASPAPRPTPQLGSGLLFHFF